MRNKTLSTIKLHELLRHVEVIAGIILAWLWTLLLFQTGGHLTGTRVILLGVDLFLLGLTLGLHLGLSGAPSQTGPTSNSQGSSQ